MKTGVEEEELLRVRIFTDGACSENPGPGGWAAPSLDHIQPTSKGGSYELDNLQILTWFENRAKCDMTNDEWQEFKLKTKTTSTYFV